MILLVDNRSSQLIYNVGIFTKFIAEKNAFRGNRKLISIKPESINLSNLRYNSCYQSDSESSFFKPRRMIQV